MRALEIVFFHLPALTGLAVVIVLMAAAVRRSFAKARTWIVAILCIALLIHLIVFLNTTFSYVAFPYEGKSVVEGAILYNASQYLHGVQPYRPPEAIPFTSQVYPPVYEMALAGVFALTGVSFFAARLFSLLCALGTAVVAGLAVWRWAKSALPAILAAMLVVGMYGLTGQWVEQVRCDALMQFLVALGLYLTWRPASRGRFPIAGLIVLLLALYTKQVAIFAPAAVIVFLWRRSQRTALVWAAEFAGCAVLAFLAMQAWSGDWFAFYTLRVPFSAGTDWGKLALSSTLAGATWLLILGVAVASIVWMKRDTNTRDSDGEPSLWLLAFGGAAALCLIQSLKWGAAFNSFIPLVPPLAVLGGMAFHELDGRLREPGWLRLALPAAAAMQMALLSYPPATPSEADYAAQRRIGEWVLAAPGDAFVAVFSSQVFLNGKTYFGDNVPMGDLKRAGVWKGNEIVEKARRGEFALMVLRPKVEPEELAEAVREMYAPVEQIPMRTDLIRWPYMQVYVPKAAPWRPAESALSPAEASRQ